MGLGPGFFILTVDFENVLHKGLNGIILEAETELRSLKANPADSLGKATFFKSVFESPATVPISVSLENQ